MRYKDVIFLAYSGILDIMPATALAQVSEPVGWKRFFKTIGFPITYLWRGIRALKDGYEAGYKPLRDSVWLFCISQNNITTLEPLQAYLPDSIFVTNENTIRKDSVRIRSYFKQLYHFYKFPIWFFKLLLKDRKRTLAYADFVVRSFGLYEMYMNLLKKYRPRCIVFSNDHHPQALGLILAAKDLGIPTAYLPHASVNNRFPPLRFDLNLLEGKAMMEIYESCGVIEGKVELIGTPKFDKWTALKKKDSGVLKSIGICFNQFDEKEKVWEVISFLKENFPDVNITFRPHPSEPRSFDDWGNDFVAFSHPKEESAFAFLNRHEIILAGETGIHLEAAMLGVLPFYYNFSNQEISDWYGFIKKGLVMVVSDMEDLKAVISKEKTRLGKPNAEAVKYYNAAYGEPWEANTTQRAAELIKKIYYV